MPLVLDLSTAEDLLVTISPTDVLGKPSAIEAGSLAGTRNTPDTLADGVVVDPAAYGITDAGTEALLFVTTGVIGSYEVRISGDADPGSGVRTISDVVSGVIQRNRCVGLNGHCVSFTTHAFALNLGVGARGVPKA